MIAAASSVTSEPITIVPVRELTIIFAAGVAGSNSRFSSTDKKLTLSLISRGALTRTEVESIALAEPSIKSLIVSDFLEAIIYLLMFNK